LGCGSGSAGTLFGFSRTASHLRKQPSGDPINLGSKLSIPSLATRKTMVAPLGTSLRTRPGTGPTDAGKTPSHGEAPASPVKQRRLGAPGSGPLSGLSGAPGGDRFKSAAAAGGSRLRSGAGELAKLMGGKIKEQLTPENIAKVALTVGKVAIKSAPAAAGGPAALAAAVMANGGTEIAKGVVNELKNPETQKKMAMSGAKMAVQAFSKPPDASEATPAA
jgi:hypothetical protein